MSFRTKCQLPLRTTALSLFQRCSWQAVKDGIQLGAQIAIAIDLNCIVFQQHLPLQQRTI